MRDRSRSCVSSVSELSSTKQSRILLSCKGWRRKTVWQVISFISIFNFFSGSQTIKTYKKKNPLTIVVEEVKCFCLFEHTYFWSGSLLLTSLENAGLPFTVDHRVQSEVNLIACIPFRWSLQSPPYRSVTPEVCRHRPRTWQAKAVQLFYWFILVSVKLADSMLS